MNVTASPASESVALEYGTALLPEAIVTLLIVLVEACSPLAWKPGMQSPFVAVGAVNGTQASLESSVGSAQATRSPVADTGRSMSALSPGPAVSTWPTGEVTIVAFGPVGSQLSERPYSVYRPRRSPVSRSRPRSAVGVGLAVA